MDKNTCIWFSGFFGNLSSIFFFYGSPPRYYLVGKVHDRALAFTK
jgi:hypothetical protein